MSKFFNPKGHFIAFSLLFPMFATWAQIEPAGDDEDPQGIVNPESTGDRLKTQKQRDWKKHPGFFHYGLVVQANFMTAGGDITGAVGGVNGLGWVGWLFWITIFRALGYLVFDSWQAIRDSF